MAVKWVASAYFLEGFCFALVSSITVILYKNLNFDNTSIAFYTSLLTIPYFLKPFISPLIESLGVSKRTLILSASLFLSLLNCLITLIFNSPYFFFFSFIFFFIMALLSAILDLNVDGLYITRLLKNDQAKLIGLRTISYQIGKLVCDSGLVIFASLFFLSLGVKVGWQLAFIVIGLLLFLVTTYHWIALPRDSKQTNSFQPWEMFRNLHVEIIQHPNLKLAIAFLFIFNFAENQLIKIVPLFLLDKSGLNLNTMEVGFIYGGIGIASMLAGILVSGFIITKFSIKSSLVPVTLFVAITNAGYLLLSIFHVQNLILIAIIIGITQFSFGLSNGIYLLYLLYNFGRGSMPVSMYAIGTSLMGLSATFGGAISGYLQFLLGYRNFFIWIILISCSIVFFSIYIIKKDVILK